MGRIQISVLTPTIRPAGLERVAEGLRLQTKQEFEWLVEINVTHKVDFNKAMNRMLRRAKGELIVSLQDFISITPVGLENFWRAYKKEPAFYTAPVGKIKVLEGPEPNWDWRKEREGKIDWAEWEIDWAAVPASMLWSIGGFDEELDFFWGFDNVNVGLRAQLAGYNFYNLRDNPAIAFDHDAVMYHPFRDRRNEEFHNKRLDQFRQGLKIDYLKR